MDTIQAPTGIQFTFSTRNTRYCQPKMLPCSCLPWATSNWITHYHSQSSLSVWTGNVCAAAAAVPCSSLVGSWPAAFQQILRLLLSRGQRETTQGLAQFGNWNLQDFNISKEKLKLYTVFFWFWRTGQWQNVCSSLVRWKSPNFEPQQVIWLLLLKAIPDSRG